MRYAVRLSPGVVIESIGDDCLVMLPGESTVVTLSGDESRQALAIRDGEEVRLNDLAVQTLIRLGVVSEAPNLTRRHLVKAGALGASVGVTLLAMPTVAMASSEDTLLGLTFRRTGTRDGDPKIDVRVPMGDGFVRPSGDPEPLGAKVGPANIPASDIFGGWSDDSETVEWEILTAHPGAGTYLEVRFRWGELTYRAIGSVP